MHTLFAHRTHLLALLALLLPSTLSAQSPWERAAGNLATTFTGPMGYSIALIGTAVVGFKFVTGDPHAKEYLAMLVLGGGLILFAPSFVAWLF